MLSLLAEESPQSTGNRSVLGVVVAPVVDNIDLTRKGSVKVRIPWGTPAVLDAQVAAPAAGQNRGVFMMPKVGDNVLLAFEGGDPRHPYVIGALWGGTDTAPIEQPAGANTQRVIRSATGQEIRIDEAADSVTVKTAAGQEVHCTTNGVQIKSGNMASVSLKTDGTVEISANQSINMKAPRISIEAQASLTLSANGETKVSGNASCSIDGGIVRIK